MRQKGEFYKVDLDFVWHPAALHGNYHIKFEAREVSTSPWSSDPRAIDEMLFGGELLVSLRNALKEVCLEGHKTWSHTLWPTLITITACLSHVSPRLTWSCSVSSAHIRNRCKDWETLKKTTSSSPPRDRQPCALWSLIFLWKICSLLPLTWANGN